MDQQLSSFFLQQQRIQTPTASTPILNSFLGRLSTQQLGDLLRGFQGNTPTTNNNNAPFPHSTSTSQTNFASNPAFPPPVSTTTFAPTSTTATPITSTTTSSVAFPTPNTPSTTSSTLPHLGSLANIPGAAFSTSPSSAKPLSVTIPRAGAKRRFSDYSQASTPRTCLTDDSLSYQSSSAPTSPTVHPYTVDVPDVEQRVKGAVYIVRGLRKKWDGRRFARCCDVVGCTKLAQGTTTLCKSHGGGTRCSEQGCNKAARGGSERCAMHGGGKRCTVSGCSKAAIGADFCRRHGGGRQCKVEGCTTSARGKTDFCVAHGGGARCRVAGCGKAARAGSGGAHYCRRHGGGKRCAVPICKKSTRGKSVYCASHLATQDLSAATTVGNVAAAVAGIVEIAGSNKTQLTRSPSSLSQPATTANSFPFSTIAPPNTKTIDSSKLPASLPDMGVPKVSSGLWGSLHLNPLGPLVKRQAIEMNH